MVENYKDILSRKLSENVTVEKQKLRVESPLEDNERGMTMDSTDFNSDEMIKEFNRKLHSVQQLNQQHQCLIKNLNSKFGELPGGNPEGKTAAASSVVFEIKSLSFF